MSINENALQGLITTGSNMTLKSIKTTILSLRLETTIGERQEGYQSAIKDILNIIDIYETVSFAKAREQEDKTND